MLASSVLLRNKPYEQELIGRAYYRQSSSCVVAIMPSPSCLIRLSAASALATLVCATGAFAQSGSRFTNGESAKESVAQINLPAGVDISSENLNPRDITPDGPEET